MDISIFNQVLQAAETVFLNPSVLYKYEDIIQGVMVNGIRKKAVDTNTTQAFGKKLYYGNFFENKLKAMEVCDEIFLYKKDWIINELSSQISTREAMDEFEYKLFIDLQEALLAYSTPSLIKESYNRIRKIVDLYVEHIVAMAREIDSETRKKLIPLLFLPIDNWIIKNKLIFDDISIDCWNLTRDSSFGEIKTKALYDDMQQYLVKKAHEISIMLGKEFYVIYFDVFWNNRINNPGGNLFGVQTNYDFGNIKVDVKETINVHKRHFKPSNFSSFTVDNDDMNDNASYPPLVSIFVDEFMKFGIYLEKDFRCIKRNDGGYIFEAVYPRGKRKNIITIWPNKRGGGDIRIVGIGKYKDRRQFDYSDIGTSVLKEDLLEAYRRTQQ